MVREIPRQVDSAKKTCRIIEILRKKGEIGVTELANELEISKSTVHGHLATLNNEGLVVKDDHTYRLSLQFVRISESVKSGVADTNTVREEVRELADITGEVVHFGAKEGGHVVYLEKDRGDSAVQTVSEIGEKMPIHSTSLGKAILAELPRNEVDQIVEEYGLPERTENTVTDVGDLHEELDEISSRGYSIDDEENIPGVRCIGAAVSVPGTEAIGALSISGPSQRMTDERITNDLQERIAQTANVIEVNSLYS
ncbi:IclR family transcriptional regulator [Haloterrigena sp. SYSU A121-1]|uniref:IclR family transcriptional regulator n=1 Tax=Haloterrigena gelatinilytica TaxID=2741724 RepID=A0A8J8GRE3_9EURY|nr:IclR family transcriptional regulator [Haloterrigena gelatinilytica]NUB93780.1 IclR family transcriptional regulator [Haloterrigena gelatinilytica]